MRLQPLHWQTVLAAAWHLLIGTEQRPAKPRREGRFYAFFLVLVLLTGCAIDGAQDVRLVTDPPGGSGSPMNVSWTQVVGIERGFPDSHAH